MGRDALARLGFRARERPELEPGPGLPGRDLILLFTQRSDGWLQDTAAAAVSLPEKTLSRP